MRTVDALRGVAAFAVTWHHFTGRDSDFLPEGWFKSTGFYGWLGVEMFFVISGFVIPWALWRAHYRLADYPMFLLKRVVRLDPPYLVSIVLALGGAWLQWHLYGRPVPVNGVDLLLHLGYLNAFFGHPWINGVYWTLAIEVQYYLVVGLLAAGLTSARPTLRRTTLALFAALTLVPVGGTFLCEYALLFVQGISTFQHKAGRIGLREHLLVLALATVGLCFVKPPEVLVVGAGTALTITFATLENRVLLFLGRISYSLYLVHGPLNGHMTGLGERFALGTPARIALLFATTVLTLGLAWLLYRWVERPARDWASRLRYRHEMRA